MGSYFEKGRGRYKGPKGELGSWRFDFTLYNQRYRAPRGFRTKKLCDQAEQALRDQIMLERAGVVTKTQPSVTFAEWAGVTYAYAKEREQLSAPEELDGNLRQILLFWGEKPPDPEQVIEGAPYHNLTLDAPIRDGAWLWKFEEWMAAKGISGSTRNHYRSACSKLYRVAMLPMFRSQTGITINPFLGLPRDRVRKRNTVLSDDQLRALLAHAPEFLKLAIRIALLAPNLRLSNIADLKWRDMDEDLQWIRLSEHKTARSTQQALVTPIVPALREYLLAARAKQPKRIPKVVWHREFDVTKWTIHDAFKEACKAAKIPYGMKKKDGVTFHSLRHTAVTRMAEIGIPDAQRKEAVGHSAIQTTQGYTHLAPMHKIAPLVSLAKSLAATLDGTAPKPRLVRRAERFRA